MKLATRHLPGDKSLFSFRALGRPNEPPEGLNPSRVQYLLHFCVDSLTHLCPAVSHQDRTVFVNVDQRRRLL